MVKQGIQQHLVDAAPEADITFSTLWNGSTLRYADARRYGALIEVVLGLHLDICIGSGRHQDIHSATIPPLLHNEEVAHRGIACSGHERRLDHLGLLCVHLLVPSYQRFLGPAADC